MTVAPEPAGVKNVESKVRVNGEFVLETHSTAIPWTLDVISEIVQVFAPLIESGITLPPHVDPRGHFAHDLLRYPPGPY